MSRVVEAGGLIGVSVAIAVAFRAFSPLQESEHIEPSSPPPVPADTHSLNRRCITVEKPQSTLGNAVALIDMKAMREQGRIDSQYHSITVERGESKIDTTVWPDKIKIDQTVQPGDIVCKEAPPVAPPSVDKTMCITVESPQSTVHEAQAQIDVHTMRSDGTVYRQATFTVERGGSVIFQAGSDALTTAPPLRQNDKVCSKPRIVIAP